jgi:methionine salvage enolase-phosphatase E1
MMVQIRDRGTAVRFFNLGSWWGLEVNATRRLLYFREIALVAILQEAGWASGALKHTRSYKCSGEIWRSGFKCNKLKLSSLLELYEDNVEIFDILKISNSKYPIPVAARSKA